MARLRLIVVGLVVALAAGAGYWLGTRSDRAPGRAPGVGGELANRADGPRTEAVPGSDEICGRVVTVGTGEPVSGAEVVVAHEFECVTDEEGRFELPRPDDLTFAQFDVYSSTHRSVRTSQPIGREPIVISLVPGLTVAGRVVTRDGDPVPGLELTSVGRTQAWTDAEGRFSSGGHEPGPVHIRVRDTEAVVEAGETDARIVVDGAFLHVRTVDESGAPVRGVRFESVDGEFFVESGGSAWPARFDYVLLSSIPGGTIRTDLRKEGYLPRRFEWTPRSAGAGVARETVVLQERPPHALTIRVLNADGSPPKRALFALLGDGGLRLVEATVDLKEGIGVVRGVPEGQWLARVHGDLDAALGVEVGVTIRPGDDNRAEFDLRPGAVFAVRWTRYSQRYRLEFFSEDDPVNRFYFSEYRTRPGWWGVGTRLPAGRYRLRELRQRDVVREEAVQIVGTEPVYVDWSKESN